MKKLFLATAISAILSSTAFAEQPTTANSFGGAAISSAVNGSSFSVNGGSSQSGALNSQTATVAVTAVTNVDRSGEKLTNSASTTSGVGSTVSTGYAYNLSTGRNSFGSASTTGYAVQGASGTQNVHNVGDGSGYEISGSYDNIVASTNQGASFGAVTGAAYNSQVSWNNTGTNNTTSTQSINATTSGSSYAVTQNNNGVYVDGNSIAFGGNSNKINNTDNLTNLGGGIFNASADAGTIVSVSSTVNSGE